MSIQAQEMADSINTIIERISRMVGDFAQQVIVAGLGF